MPQLYFFVFLFCIYTWYVRVVAFFLSLPSQPPFTLCIYFGSLGQVVRRQKAIVEKEEVTREKAKAADERKRKALAKKKVKGVSIVRTGVLAAPIVRFGD